MIPISDDASTLAEHHSPHTTLIPLLPTQLATAKPQMVQNGWNTSHCCQIPAWDTDELAPLGLCLTCRDKHQQSLPSSYFLFPMIKQVLFCHL